MNKHQTFNKQCTIYHLPNRDSSLLNPRTNVTSEMTGSKLGFLELLLQLFNKTVHNNVNPRNQVPDPPII